MATDAVFALVPRNDWSVLSTTPDVYILSIIKFKLIFWTLALSELVNMQINLEGSFVDGKEPAGQSQQKGITVNNDISRGPDKTHKTQTAHSKPLWTLGGGNIYYSLTVREGSRHSTLSQGTIYKSGQNILVVSSHTNDGPFACVKPDWTIKYAAWTSCQGEQMEQKFSLA